MTEQPNTVADAQLRLHADMRNAYVPMAQPADQREFWNRQKAEMLGRIEPVEPAPEVKRSHRMIWMIVVPMVIVGAIALARGLTG